MHGNKSLNKTIWFLWFQGIEDAPFVVLKCYESWHRHNPGWNLVLLTDNNLHEYVSVGPGQFTKQALSDIIRINLLAAKGGVWIDATCFCTKPLDEWLYDYLRQGFFAFERPGPDRMISSWFIACQTGNYLVGVYQNAVNNYRETNPGIVYIEDSKWRFLQRRLIKLGPQVWFKVFVTKVLKVYPYFWFHYLFEKIYLDDAGVKKIWDDSPKFKADIPHSLQFAGLFNPLNDQIKAEIDDKRSPVYKLTWKYDEAELKKGTIIDYLL
jgi:hypothetical protein